MEDENKTLENMNENELEMEQEPQEDNTAVESALEAAHSTGNFPPEHKAPSNTGNSSAGSAGSTGSAGGNSGDKGKTDLKSLAFDTSIVAYGYIRKLKSQGNTSIGDLIFREIMNMNCAASLASESFGRDRFLDYLEKGFYSSGRLLVYLDFAGAVTPGDGTREALIEAVTGVHKIFAASCRTVRSKQYKTSRDFVNV